MYVGGEAGVNGLVAGGKDGSTMRFGTAIKWGLASKGNAA